MTSRINFNQLKGAVVNIFDFLSPSQINEVETATAMMDYTVAHATGA